MITEVEWDISELHFSNASTSCQLLLVENLPSGLYVDLDEVQNGVDFGGPKVCGYLRFILLCCCPIIDWSVYHETSCINAINGWV